MDLLIQEDLRDPDLPALPRGFAALPADAPLEMPVQDLYGSVAPRGAPASSPRFMFARRVFVLGTAMIMTAAAAREMHLVLGGNGINLLDVTITLLFVALFAWIALALVSACCGFVSVLSGGGRSLDAPLSPNAALASHTALLMPTYNEEPARVTAALQVIYEDLSRLGVLRHFDLFILSDTTDPDIWIAEEAAFLALRERCGVDTGIYYRRRPKNIERKSGNVSDWVRRFGAAYPHMLVLDADSVMTGECIVRLTHAMERHADIGLIQTLPIIVGGETLLARLQQFAGRVYGPVIAHGIAWWYGAEGNYWGHNAIIRTAAFAAHAGLPVLQGRKPFGGAIMSHDFVEAALLRRAGWAVHMMPALPGSYEEGPATLPDLAVRDRRWCQGNLQHIAVLPSRGVHWVSRLHLMMGIGAYLTAPLWAGFLLAGIMVSLRSQLIPHDYFPAGPSLFPNWPIVDPVRSMWLFVATLGVLLGPKALSVIAVMLMPAKRRAFGGITLLICGLLVETVLSGLIAPLTMLSQSWAVITILSGRDGGWKPQSRDGSAIPVPQIARHYAPQTLIGLLLAVIAWQGSPAFFWWMSPITFSLALATPIVVLVGARSAGRWLRNVGILTIPEERETPAVLMRAANLRASMRDSVAFDAFGRLFENPSLLAAHLAMLPPARRPGRDPLDPPTVLGVAKLSEASGLGVASRTLTAQEKAAVLGDREGIALAIALHRETRD